MAPARSASPQRGGAHYHDLPPSYDQAQAQAVADARHGITPIDPSRLEAHRLTLNEGPNEPEVWEYRVRREESDVADDHEPAPEYGSPPTYWTSTVSIQHVASPEPTLVGQTPSRPPADADPSSSMVDQALGFIQHAPPANAHASHLLRLIAIPQLSGSGQQQVLHDDSVHFLRAYPEVLASHGIRPVDFMAFLDGLNAMGSALPDPDAAFSPKNLMDLYIRKANKRFFCPRGLFVSLQSFTTLLRKLDIPSNQRQRASAIATTLDWNSSAAQRAEALYPWIEKLHLTVPPASTPGPSSYKTCGSGNVSPPQDPGRINFSDHEGLAVQSRRTFQSPDPSDSHGQSMGKGSEEYSQHGGESSKPFRKIPGAVGPGDEQTWTEKVAARKSGSYQSHAGPSIVRPSAQNILDQTSPGQEEDVIPTKVKGKAKTTRSNDENVEDDHYDEDSDTSSTASESTLDSVDEEWPNTEVIFQQHMRRINEVADTAMKKGERTSSEISRERATEIELAQTKKKAMELQIERRASKRAALGDLKKRGRDLKMLHRQKKRDLWTVHEGKNKGKAKSGEWREAKKSGEWREAKKEYKAQKKQLREEKLVARKEWRAVRKDMRNARRDERLTDDKIRDATRILWLVMENLDQHSRRNLP